MLPNIRIVIADGGHQSRRLTRGSYYNKPAPTLQIVKRRQREFKITGLTWIARARASLGLAVIGASSKDYEYRVQSSLDAGSKSLHYASCSTDWHRLETFQTSSKRDVFTTLGLIDFNRFAVLRLPFFATGSILEGYLIAALQQ